MRPRHPNKHIEESVQYAESRGWRVEISNGHDWGRLFCPEPSRDGHIVGVYSTPRRLSMKQVADSGDRDGLAIWVALT
jgi:hypothetical protein